MATAKRKYTQEQVEGSRQHSDVKDDVNMSKEKDECGLRCSEAFITTKQEVRAKTVPDGGFSWFVVFGSFMIQFVVMGVHNVFGLLYIELLKEFDEDKATVAWIGSSSFSLLFLFGPLTTALCTKYGCRGITVLGALLFGLGLLLSSYVETMFQLFITYSLLFSAGSSCCYYTSVLILSEYFSKKLVFANGVGLSGCGLGTLTLAPVINYFIDAIHWRATVQILSATSIVLVLVGWIYFAVPVPLRNDDAAASQIHEAPKLFDASLLRNKAFLLWIAAVGLVLFGFYIPYVHLVQHGQDLDIPKSKCAVLVGSMAISQAVGKIVFGRLSDNPRVNRIYLFQMCLLVCSVMSTLLPVFASFESLLVYSIIFGLHDGCFVVHLAILTGDIAGKKKMVSAFGLMYFFTALPMMLGPPVAGWMYETIHNYEPAFYMSGALTILAVCLLFLVPFFIPPEVEQEWNRQLVEEKEVLVPSNVNERVFLAHEYNDCKESTKHLDKFCSESKSEKTFTASVESIVQKYFSMPRLVAWEDCILSKMFVNSTENLWGLLDTSQETYV